MFLKICFRIWLLVSKCDKNILNQILVNDVDIRVRLYRARTLVPIFFLEQSGVHVSMCGNVARVVLAGWLIAKSRANF